MMQAGAKEDRSTKLLIFLGVLWLFFAAAHLLYQLSNPTIEIQWETATELETAGFHLYRSSSPDGDYVHVNAEDGMIPSEGDALSGAVYTYIDRNVSVGETYYYLLEEVEYSSNTNRYDDEVFLYTVPYMTWWTAVLTAVSLIIGVALIITGLREDKNL